VSDGRLGLLVSSPRVAPGLLSHGGWDAVVSASLRLARSRDEPLVEAVEEAGFPVEEVGDVTPADLARRLIDLASTTSLVWLGSSDGDPGLADAVAAEVSRLESPPDVELVVGSWDVQGGRLLDVVATMDRLRSEGGCPWDADQTHESLAPYLVEEAHEVVHAIATGDRAHLAEELGDVLLQVVFHARVAEEAPEGAFDVDTVAGLLVEKLVRRHPHVFADGDASTPAEVEQEWERIKAQEKAGAAGAGGAGDGAYAADLLHGIPETLPPQLAADKVLARVRRRGLDPEAAALAELEAARVELDAAEARVRAALRGIADSLS
jgi:XTP/dITP diphosphohydrolase